MAVLTPFRAQLRELKRVLPTDVELSTVDRFQGKDAACVVVSFARADASSGLLADPRRLNVALDFMMAGAASAAARVFTGPGSCSHGRWGETWAVGRALLRQSLGGSTAPAARVGAVGARGVAQRFYCFASRARKRLRREDHAADDDEPSICR